MDHDRVFKELLGTFFHDFLRLFTPELAAEIEEATLVPLDKEIFSDVTSGARHEVDLLVSVRLKGRGERIVLIHVETQSSPQPLFAKRMFRYFARLSEKHDQPIYPIALFTYDKPRRPEPASFEVRVGQEQILGFHFKAIQLNRLRWQDFRDVQNPLATALMAKMGIEPKDRARVKWECFVIISSLKLNPAKVEMLTGFIDAYLRLSEPEEQEFQALAAAAAPEVKEAVMELPNTWIERGLKQGRQEGRHETLQNLVTRLLTKRLGTLGPERIEAVKGLSADRLENLAKAIFEIESDADLASWLRQSSGG